MNEIIFILFLLSGAIKTFLIYFHIPTGIDFTLLTAIILIVFLIKDLLSHNMTIILNKTSKYAIYLIISLFILILFSLTYTSSQQYAYTKLLQFFAILLGFIFPLLIHNFSVDKFLKWFIISVGIMTIIFLPLFIAGYKSFSTQYLEYQNSPLAMVYQSYLTMGYLIAIAFIISTFSSSFMGTKKVLISLFFFAVLLITGARGPLFGVIIITFLFLLLKDYRIKKPKVSTMISTFLIIAILSIFVLPKLDVSSLLERTFNRVTTIKKDVSANDHLIRANFVINHLDAEHFILGYGFGSFGYEYSGIDTRSYPHNILLEILFELGVTGLVVFSLLILLIIKVLFKRKNFLQWALFLFLFLNSLKFLALTDSRVLFGFFAIFLIFHSYHKPLNQDQHQ